MKLFLNQKLKVFFLTLVPLLGLATTGCAPKTKPIPLTALSMNTVLTPHQQHTLLARLERAGVQVIQQGSRLQLILPVNRFFLAQTTEIRERQVRTLQLIALYLHNYTRT